MSKERWTAQIEALSHKGESGCQSPGANDYHCLLKCKVVRLIVATASRLCGVHMHTQYTRDYKLHLTTILLVS